MGHLGKQGIIYMIATMLKKKAKHPTNFSRPVSLIIINNTEYPIKTSTISSNRAKKSVGLARVKKKKKKRRNLTDEKADGKQKVYEFQL